MLRGHIVSKSLGKGESRWDVGDSFSPNSFKEMLCVINVQTDGTKCISLVDSGCSWSLVSGSVCRSWSWQKMDILIADSKVLHRSSVGTTTLALDDIDPAKADALVIDSQLLGFDLLIGMDVIKMLGGVSITESGEAICDQNRTGFQHQIWWQDQGVDILMEVVRWPTVQ